MVSIYVFDGEVIGATGKHIIYPSKEYQEKLSKLHGKKGKVNSHRGKRLKVIRIEVIQNPKRLHMFLDPLPVCIHLPLYLA